MTEVDRSVPRVDRVVAGLQLLRSYEGSEDCGICAEHDVIYAGHSMALSEEDLTKMATYGWGWDEDVESWYFFT